MAEDPINQAQFAADVAAAEAAGGSDAAYNNLGDPNGNFKMPSVEEIWEIIQGMEDISDEDREEMRKNLFNPPTAGQELQPQHTSTDYMIFFAMIALVLLVFALFGFKLYKSVMAKELKKQEKLKSKQSKKSKKTN